MEHAPDRRPLRVIGMAASAGGVETLRHIVADLDADLPAAICIVLHIPATGRSLLAPILDRDSGMTASVARDGTALEAGHIYVAPADHHLLVRADHIELSRGPKENGVRPAADPLFRSLGEAWGPAAVGVVLSGALDDGSAGIKALAEQGGTVIVQDPDDAIVPSMPASAIAVTVPDRIVPAAEMSDVLREVVGAPARKPQPEVAMVEPDPVDPHAPQRPTGAASGFTCPECSGALWELRDGALVRYRCRVGHTYSEEAMVEAQGSAVEAALWAALEVLEERSELLDRIAARMAPDSGTGARFRETADTARERAALIRRALVTGEPVGVDEAAG